MLLLLGRHRARVSLYAEAFHLAESNRNLVLDIDSFNKTMAKPFRWTYQGKPLTA